MPRFLRKSPAKESKKDKKTEKNKKTKEKTKDKTTWKSQPANLYDEEEEEENSMQNGFIGVGRCRRLLASCPNRSGSAKCVATFKRKSRLSKCLLEVLMDDSVLPYFMEYMQTQNATNLLNFWLTTETFRLSTISRLKINTLSRIKSTLPAEILVNGNEECEGAGSSNEDRQRILSDSSSDSEFGCFASYSDTTEHSGTKQLLDKLNTGALLICDKCGNIVPKNNSECMICDPNYVGEQTDGDKISEVHCSNALEDVFDEMAGKSDAKKVTFDLKPDYENEEREFCRRRTRSIIIDAMSIYSRYISLEATHPFGLDEPLRRQVEANICSEDGKIDPECFSPAQAFAFRVMDRMYFPPFVRSPLYCKHQLDILTGSKVFLSDIIYNEHAMFYFMEFLDQEGVRHMLEFWLTGDNFQLMLKDKLANGEYNSQQALDDAMIIYERYFSMQASLPLGFDDVTRIEIENNICRDGGPLPDCLSTPLEHILCLLEEVFFPSFLQSDIYFKYLNELLNSVSDTPHETTQDSEITTAKVQHTNESTRLVTSFGSELDLAENPDAIWHRPNAGPLSIGRVNEFGIYEPIFDPEPDRDRHNTSTAAKLGKAMRKLVSGGEDKAKEEMAWKIAKMMIEDVKTQTKH